MAYKRNMKKYKWVAYHGERYYSVGHEKDGILYNPNGYREESVQAILEEIAERRRQRKADGIRRAVATRAKRRELRINEVAMAILRGEGIGNQGECACCKKLLADPESIDRSIGPECWQNVLDMVQRHKERRVLAATGL
jgi:Family of unknown function (DUF6011)